MPINSKYSGDITIPKKVTFSGKEYPVVALEDECFSNCDSLTSVIIPSSVTAIGNECFRNCRNLTSVTIPSSVTAIGQGCFSACSNLATITIPSSVTVIGMGCFSSCDSLRTITIPSSVTAIGDYCFFGCSSLTTITIPSSVTAIGNECFYDCGNLLSLTCYAEGLSNLNNSDLSSVCQIYVPKARLDYYKQALANYKYIYAIEEAKVKTNFFETIDSIKYLINVYENNATVVPINSKYSGDITIPEKATFSGKEYPVVALEDECFYSCDGLTSVTIPSSVTEIGNKCFRYCSSLTTISIPSSVTTIGEGCFSKCSNLHSLTCYAEELGSLNDSELSSKCKIYVPKARLDYYKQTLTKYKNIHAIK